MHVRRLDVFCSMCWCPIACPRLAACIITLAVASLRATVVFTTVTPQTMSNVQGHLCFSFLQLQLLAKHLQNKWQVHPQLTCHALSIFCYGAPSSLHLWYGRTCRIGTNIIVLISRRAGRQGDGGMVKKWKQSAAAWVLLQPQALWCAALICVQPLQGAGVWICAWIYPLLPANAYALFFWLYHL